MNIQVNSIPLLTNWAFPKDVQLIMFVQAREEWLPSIFPVWSVTQLAKETDRGLNFAEIF